ncbi:Abi family protein [Trueperella bonasi]|uniref:Abi family protein n=1 Tax=Trueperella bonasi TaxID=312286 RepID=UPI00389A1A7C
MRRAAIQRCSDRSSVKDQLPLFSRICTELRHAIRSRNFLRPRDPQDVFDLIALDQNVSNCLFDLIRQVELNLRTKTVDFFCANGSPTRYLDESRFEKLPLEIDEHSERTWRKLAASLDMKAPVYATEIESLSITRNLVCHHAR